MIPPWAYLLAAMANALALVVAIVRGAIWAGGVDSRLQTIEKQLAVLDGRFEHWREITPPGGYKL